MKFQQIRYFSLLLVFVFLLSACEMPIKYVDEEALPTDSALPPAEPPTDAEADPALEANMALLSTLPETGMLELRIKLGQENETECLQTYPFNIRPQDERILLTGDGQVQVECHLKADVCEGSCATLNILLELQTRLDGEITAADSEEGRQTLNLYYFYDGELVEYYSDTPDDAALTYTEANPLREPAGDLAAVTLPFEDGAGVILMDAGSIFDPGSLPVPLDALIWELTLVLP